MSEQKETDLHKRDALVGKGEKLGHANKESHIRRRDGMIFKGQEIGYVDRHKNVRRPDGIVFKEEVVGQIKGTVAQAKDGLIFEGEQWGYVDDDGNIRQRDGIIFRGRIVGEMRGHNKEGALGFFVLRFKELLDRFKRLEQEARRSEHKGKFVPRVRHTLSYVPEYEGLGDFDDLIRRLRRLESDLVDAVARQRESRVNAKEALIREAERCAYSSEWKTTAAELKSPLEGGRERWR